MPLLTLIICHNFIYNICHCFEQVNVCWRVYGFLNLLFSEEVVWRYSVKMVFIKISEYSQEASVLKSLCKKVAGFQAFSKKSIQQRCFRGKITKFLRTPILENICVWIFCRIFCRISACYFFSIFITYTQAVLPFNISQQVSISLYFENIIQKSNLYSSNSAILEDIRDIYSLKFFIYGSPVQFMPESQPRV